MSHYLRWAAFILAIGFVSSAFADDKSLEGAPPAGPEPVVVSREQQNSQIESRSSVIIDQIGQNYIIPNNRNYHVGQKVVLVRIDKSRFEIISRGTIAKLRGKEAQVAVEGQSLTKFPLAGDFVLKLGEPWVPPPEKTPPTSAPEIKAEEVGVPGDPGYIEFKFDELISSINSTGSTNANQYKQVGSYRFPGYSFVWFFEYGWRLGIEYQSYSGDFPTTTYYHQNVASSEQFTKLILNYRSRKFWDDNFRWTARLGQESLNFTTGNTDEGVLSSQFKATPVIGAKFAYERGSLIWSDKTEPFKMKLSQIYIDVLYAPLGSNTDGVVSRGSSSTGTTGTDLRIGADVLIYMRWFPVFKRWVLNFEYGQMTQNIKMSGPTTSAADGFYTIPAGGDYKEVRSFYLVQLGVRFDDFLLKFFKPR